MSFLDMWASNSGMNDAGFNNAEYDSLIAQAKVEKMQEMGINESC